MSNESMECPECHIYPNLHLEHIDRIVKVKVYCKRCGRFAYGMDNRTAKRNWNAMIEAEQNEGM